MNGPQISLLADGRRLHLNHGPIDLIVEAFGAAQERRLAYEQAASRFTTILAELVEELEALRSPSAVAPRSFNGAVARRMEAAVSPLATLFVTPMAAVAGAVADEVLQALIEERRLDKAYVNNGGDVALHLSAGAEMRAAIAGIGHVGASRGGANHVLISAADPVRGIATSGWRGRSHSLGIADAVTVLARSAAAADAAATLIANAVDLPGHPAIERVPANRLSPDSDLGARPVTQQVGRLTPSDIAVALDKGLALARDLHASGLVNAAALFLSGESRLCGTLVIDHLPDPRARTKSEEVAHA